ncbi:MAG: hypothetical protein ACJ8GW_08295 [Massilia sp.]
MHKLIAELRRLYLHEQQQHGGQALSPALLEQHLRGETTLVLPLLDASGATRTLVLQFPGTPQEQWEALCTTANALQHDVDFPAPAVSISGDDAFGLWLSLATPVPLAQAQRLAALLGAVLHEGGATVTLPPSFNAASGKWAAFIHPGMGSSFAEEPGLEMAPPAAAQAAFLEPLQSISSAQFAHALTTLEPAAVDAVSEIRPPLPTPHGLLLKDATLDDIVRFLHAKHIEPTFRYLIDKG